MNLANIVASVSAPSGMWANLISWIHGWVGGGYGWTILVLILFVKLVLSPLDFLIKYTSKKTSLTQQKLAPQIARLRKKYGDNQQMIQQQTQLLYKREGNNVFGSCFVMLLNLVLTFTIFLTLFSSLRKLSSYQAIVQYDTLRTTYERTASLSYIQDSQMLEQIEQTLSSGQDLSEEETEALNSALELYFADMETVNNYNSSTATDDDTANYQSAYTKYNDATNAATAAVKKQWSSVKQNWLWVKNIWVTDGHKNPFPDYSSLKSMATSSKVDEYINYVAKLGEGNDLIVFNTISDSIEAETGSWNGYYLLAIISVLLSIASMFVNDVGNKSKNKKARQVADAANPQGATAKIMKLVVPIIMAIFVLTTNAAFGIYVITNSFMTILISLATNLIINAVFAKKQAEVDAILQKEAERVARKGLNQPATRVETGNRTQLTGIDQSRFNQKRKK